mgnify:CR=1 FL=1
MRIMSNNAISKEEVQQAISAIDGKQDRQIKILACGMTASCLISIVALVVAFIK